MTAAKTTGLTLVVAVNGSIARTFINNFPVEA